MTVAGIILAGGRSTRMGGVDKATLALSGETLLDRAIRRLAIQVDDLAINSNLLTGHADYPVLRDATTSFDGPLAGVLAGLEWAIKGQHDAVLTVAVDTPFFPGDLAARLATTATNRIAVARSGGRIHPVFALWPRGALDPLRSFMERGETRKVMAFLDQFGFDPVDFDQIPIDPFFNINTADDLVEAERLRGIVDA